MSPENEGEDKSMEAKAYLERARNINLQIDSKLEQVYALRQLATKATSALSPVPPSGTPNPHRLEETIARMMDMEHEVDEAIDGLVELKADIMKAISRVPDDRERVVLELRYLAFRDWAAIAETLGLHVRQVYRLHEDALKNIEIPDKCH
jgi:DNA-directed RNA polymerase specialized sigma24 family protein